MERTSGKSVVVTDHAFKGVTAEERVALGHGARFTEHDCRNEAQTIDALRDVDVAIVNFAPITQAVLERMAPGATVIRYGIGYDNVDVAAAKELGVQVANVPDYGLETVADHAAASVLALGRKLPIYDERIKADGWVRPAEVGPIRGFRSTVVGFLGMGRIAQALHRRLVPFGFSFVAYDPHCPTTVFESLGIQQVTLEELAARAHAISLHAPSTAETHHIVDADFLARLQPGALVVNTARGHLVDESALSTALREGQLGAAALDVFESEPLPAASPLRGAPNLLLTPHTAFYDEDSLTRLQELVSEEAGRALRGEILRCRVA